MAIKAKLIAPCGMNCALCMAYLRDKNHCPGCREQDRRKAKYCRRCVIKLCRKRQGADFCYTCATMPCARLKHLDKRYRAKYGMSMLENLNYIKNNGIRKFVAREKRRYVKGDKIFCVHHHCYVKTSNIKSIKS